jgi:alkanesulfonate monooxygenase SsuD/methylene tetrahydromethanopterin reductase-like flavin-dependent oxidoreductase (luciferase family)
MTLLSLSEFGPGRIRVAVGTGDAGLVGKLGKQINRPALNAKAFVLALRGAMAGRDMKEAHDEFSFDNFRVNPLAPAPPIDLMGIRTRMVTTAAQVADGLSISIGASLEYLRDTVALAEKELAAAGRDRSSFRITALTIGVITDDLDAGRAPIPALIAMAPQDSAAYLARGAIDAEALLEAERSGGPFAVMKQWTPDAIDRTALVCRPDALADKLAEFADTGIDELGVILLNDADQQPALIRMLAAARP